MRSSPSTTSRTCSRRPSWPAASDAGRARRCVPAREDVLAMPAIRILGIDPGLGCTGYGVLEKNRSALCYVASWRIRSDESAPLAARLATILEGLTDVIVSFHPREGSVAKE